MKAFPAFNRIVISQSFTKAVSAGRSSLRACSMAVRFITIVFRLFSPLARTARIGSARFGELAWNRTCAFSMSPQARAWPRKLRWI